MTTTVSASIGNMDNSWEVCKASANMIFNSIFSPVVNIRDKQENLDVTSQADVVCRCRYHRRSYVTGILLAISLGFASLAAAAIPDAAKKNPLFKHGYLVVTHYPGVKGDGSGDATAGIQQAIIDGFKNGYAVYFPNGTYTVSNTLKCYRWQLWNPERNKPHIRGTQVHTLVGSTNGDNRPTISLSPNAKGFGDPSKPRPVIAYRQFIATSKDTPQREIEPSHPLGTPEHFKDGSANLMRSQLRGINFDLSGHAGAIGVTFPAAQDSTIESVSIEATGAYAGFGGIPGRNAGAANIAVNGGKFGVLVGKQPGIVPGSSAGSIIVGARLVGQTESAIKQFDFAPLAVVGFHITGTSNSAIHVYKANWYTSLGTLSLIDGIIEAPAGSTAIENSAGRSIHLRNVYVGGTEELISGKNTSVVTGSGSWSRIEEYAYNEQFGTETKELSYKIDDGKFRSFAIINGKKTNQKEPIKLISGDISQPPDDLIRRHLWTPFMDFENNPKTYVLITEPPYNAVAGDGKDDSTAIQAAIDAAARSHGRVFIPRGEFELAKTIKLRANTKLVGVARSISMLKTLVDEWRPTSETPILQTVDDKDASTLLAFLSINAIVQLKSDPWKTSSPHPHDWFNFVHWRAGRFSTILSIETKQQPLPSDTPNNPRSIFRFTGNAGGRHFFFALGHSQGSDSHKDYRFITISGTHEPLWLYGVNSEATKGGQISETNVEIINAANVRLLSMKREGVSPSIIIRDSNNIGAYAAGGGMREPVFKNSGGFIQILGNSRNIVVSNVNVQKSNEDGNGEATVREALSGKPEVAVHWPESVSIYKRGELNDAAMYIHGQPDRLACHDICCLSAPSGAYLTFDGGS